MFKNEEHSSFLNIFTSFISLFRPLGYPIKPRPFLIIVAERLPKYFRTFVRISSEWCRRLPSVVRKFFHVKRHSGGENGEEILLNFH